MGAAALPDAWPCGRRCSVSLRSTRAARACGPVITEARLWSRGAADTYPALSVRPRGIYLVLAPCGQVPTHKRPFHDAAAARRFYRWAMRTLFAAAGVVIALLVCANPADAGWSVAGRLVTVPSANADAIATDARGDTAVAWSRCGSRSCEGVYVTVRPAHGKPATRRVSANGRPVAVVIGRGEVTLAWTVSRRGARELPGGFSPETLRAAYAPLAGRWAPAQTIGRWTATSYPPSGFHPHLAVAPDGEVLLAWDDYSQPIDGPAVAWRKPGHRFSVPRPLARSSVASSLRAAAPNGFGPTPAFDAGGTAYISGPCDGLVFAAPPHRHRFGPPSSVAPAGRLPWMPLPGLGFNLSLSGAGQGLASWARGACSFDAAAGNAPGPVFASILHAGKFGHPLALSSSAADVDESTAVAIPGGAGVVSWHVITSPSTLSSIHISANGALGPIEQITGQLTPVATDGRGDQVLVRNSTPLASLPWAGDQRIQGQGIAMRPIGGGPIQPAPTSSGRLATTAPGGRAAALVWSPPGGGLALTVWRP